MALWVFILIAIAIQYIIFIKLLCIGGMIQCELPSTGYLSSNQTILQIFF